MDSYAENLDRHYAPTDIYAGICRALAAKGIPPEKVRREDLTPFDEFHSGGIYSTRELARAAALRQGDYVLDAGCGIGGPARTLAAEFGCRVLGADISSGFIAAAERLTAMVGLARQVTFVAADAQVLQLPPKSFSAVWSQNTIMNMPDKSLFFRTAAMLLQPGGTLALEAVCSGVVAELHYPVFWADRQALSYLCGKEELLGLITDAGFYIETVIDTTEITITNQIRRLALQQQQGQPPGLEVIVPVDYLAKVSNSLKNNQQSRTVSMQITARLGG